VVAGRGLVVLTVGAALAIAVLAERAGRPARDGGSADDGHRVLAALGAGPVKGIVVLERRLRAGVDVVGPVRGPVLGLAGIAGRIRGRGRTSGSAAGPVSVVLRGG
jgi:hypothetical protein